MAYFGGSSGMVGDPGFFGTLGGIFKRTARVALGFATGGVGGAAQAVLRGRTRSGFGLPQRAGTIFSAQPVFRPPVRGITAGGERVPKIPVGTGTVLIDAETGEMRPKRRRMNVGNAKALRRAIRRTDGFVRLSRSALKNTGFKIVSKSSGKVSRATLDKAVAAAHHAK